MGEFSEIMRLKHRLCEGNECHVCPLGKVEFCARYDIDPKCAEQTETIIMDWAAEHPEPQYPTWEEWQKETFPDAHMIINLCNFAKCDKPCFESNCREWPIPAYIAERLGIKPKEAGE